MYNYYVIMNSEELKINIENRYCDSKNGIDLADDDFLKIFFNNNEVTDKLSLHKLEKELRNFKDLPKYSVDADVLEEWENIKMVFPSLYPIALSILSIPTTQVSVEILFSVLKWVYNEHNERRSKLKKSNIEDVFLLKLNNYL